jgi:hypothetical protein
MLLGITKLNRTFITVKDSLTLCIIPWLMNVQSMHTLKIYQRALLDLKLKLCQSHSHLTSLVCLAHYQLKINTYDVCVASDGIPFTWKLHKGWPTGLKVKRTHKDAHSMVISYAKFCPCISMLLEAVILMKIHLPTSLPSSFQVAVHNALHTIAGMV